MEIIKEKKQSKEYNVLTYIYSFQKLMTSTILYIFIMYILSKYALQEALSIATSNGDIWVAIYLQYCFFFVVFIFIGWLTKSFLKENGIEIKENIKIRLINYAVIFSPLIFVLGMIK